MTDEDRPVWRPLGVRDAPTAHEYDALVEGVPSWLERSLWRWAMDRGVRIPNLHHKAERILKVSIPQRQGENPFAPYWDAASEDDRIALLDFFLHDLEETGTEAFRAGDTHAAQEIVHTAERLDKMLTEGGSVWQLAFEPFWCLQRRANQITQSLVDLASSPETDAARKIASAWNALYRHSPDYDRAYRDAVLAVEAVALPLTVPKNKRGTLGNVVAHIGDTVDRWTVGDLDAEEQASGETLLSMLRTLWHNQERHAKPDGSIVEVPRAEAEAAVSLAVVLVHWFASGAVRRVE